MGSKCVNREWSEQKNVKTELNMINVKVNNQIEIFHFNFLIVYVVYVIVSQAYLN